MFVRVIGAVVVVAAAIYLAGYTRTAEIETAIDIDAPPEAVWAVLTDLPAYETWNPFIKSASGEIRQGGVLQIELAPVGEEGAMQFSPRVRKVVENRQFSWLGRVGVPGIFDGHHQFVLEVREGGTRLIQREDFRGLMLYFIDVAQYEPSFQAMNEAVKAKAEAAEAEKAMPAGPAMPEHAPEMPAPVPDGAAMAPEGTMMVPAPEGTMMAPADGAGQMMAPAPQGTAPAEPAPAAQ